MYKKIDSPCVDTGARLKVTLLAGPRRSMKKLLKSQSISPWLAGTKFLLMYSTYHMLVDSWGGLKVGNGNGRFVPDPMKNLS